LEASGGAWVDARDPVGVSVGVDVGDPNWNGATITHADADAGADGDGSTASFRSRR
jgi:hypothetical protein